MGRRLNVVPTVYLNVGLPLDLHTRLSAELYSELEGRVPFGAYQRFFSELLRERFSGKSLDLAPYIPDASPDAFVVRGEVPAILALRYHLEGKK